VKFDTESGVVAISLSEASLGQIHSVNMLAARQFNYFGQKEMLALRVNDLMPEIYSEVHDGILLSFLKNRYKSINQDERLLFGKNKNGFIFPFQLQLRKLSVNANDELIFIANVNAQKTKAAPINCILDLEGDIRNVSSTFAWLFLKKYKEHHALQNIQVLIPSFFKVIEEHDDTRTAKYTFEERCYAKKVSGAFEVQFTGSPIFIREQKVGYLIEGTTLESARTLNTQRHFLEDVLRKSEHRVYFTAATMSYEFHHDETLARTHSNEFNIPYLRTHDIECMFGDVGAPEKSVPPAKDYGEGIRTFRMVNNRIEIALEESSFASEEAEENWREMSVLKRIQLMKEEIDIDSNRMVTNSYRIVVVTLGLVLAVLGVVLLLEGLYLGNQITQNQIDLGYKWKVRALLPELLIYSYFPVSSPGALQLSLIRN
jgi:hypothetical protein